MHLIKRSTSALYRRKQYNADVPLNSRYEEGLVMESKIDIKYIFNSAITLLIMFGFQYLPNIGPVSDMGMNALGIFLSLVWAWTFVDLVWPSILAIVVVGLSGFCSVADSFAAAFGNSTFLLIMFSFMFASYLQMTDLTTYIAKWCISRKFVIGKPWLFTFVFLFGIYLLGPIVSSMASTIVGWAVAYEVLSTAGFKDKDKYSTLLVFSVVASGVLGTWLFPFVAINAIGINATAAIVGYDCNFILYTVLAGSVGLLSLLIWVLICKYVFKPNVGNLASDTDYFAQYRHQKMTFEQKISLTLTFVTILLILLPNLLPKSWALSQLLTALTPTGIFAIMLVLVGIVHWKGKSLCDAAKTVEKSNWTILLMCAGSMPIGGMMQAPESGISEWVNDIFMSVSGNTHIVITTILLVLLITLITQVGHNMVIIMVVSPIIATVCQNMGINPYPIIILALCAANTGLVTPGGSVLGAMIYANKKYISSKQAFGYGCAQLAVVLVVLVCVGVPLSNILFQ